MGNNNWVQTEIYAGNVDKGREYQFEFIKKSTCKNIIKVKPTCDCTTADWKGNNLVIKYKTPTEVSPEMIKLGIFAQSITKDIEIYYEDNTTDILKFYITITD